MKPKPGMRYKVMVVRCEEMEIDVREGMGPDGVLEWILRVCTGQLGRLIRDTVHCSRISS